MGKRPKQTFLQRRHTDGQQANEKMKSSLLIIREMQVKTTMRYHLTLVSMAIIKKSTNNKCWRGCGKKGNILHVGRNLSWYSHYGKQYRVSSKYQKIELSYNPVSPLLGLYPDKTIIQKDTCTPHVHSTLFTIAKTCKQPKCPLTDE